MSACATITLEQSGTAILLPVADEPGAEISAGTDTIVE